VAEIVPSGEGSSASEAGGLLLRGGIVCKGCVGGGSPKWLRGGSGHV
jgi:hypothetical protein